MEKELIELYGERCPDFEPGCACCDAWEMWDLHAYGALRAELDEVIAWCNEESLEYFDRTIAGDR